MTNNNHDLSVGFGAAAGLCGLGAFGHGTGMCKDGCGRRVILGGCSGYCAVCAPNHGLQPIKLGPEAICDPQTGNGLPASMDPKEPPAGGCC